MARGRGSRLSDKEAENQMNTTMVETRERDRLRGKLAALLEECGWRDQVKLQVREAVSERGYDNVTMEDLVQEMAPRATGMVPDKVKKELLRDMQKVLEKNARV